MDSMKCRWNTWFLILTKLVAVLSLRLWFISISVCFHGISYHMLVFINGSLPLHKVHGLFVSYIS